MNVSADLIQSSIFFDESWYLQQYPDVAYSTLTAAEHYAEYGWRLGRNPGPNFSTLEFLAENPNCVRNDVNPLVYHSQQGSGEDEEAVTAPNDDRTLPYIGAEQELRNTKLQLEETQKLLEYYYNRCEKLVGQGSTKVSL